jgi:tyrosine-protein kinase Etk/Wzc
MSTALNNGPLYNAAPDVDEEEINLGELLGVVIENRWLIAATTVLALFFGAFKAYTEIPVYRADGLLQVEENS